MQPETNISPLRHVPDSSLSAPLAESTGLVALFGIQFLVGCPHILEPTILLHLQYLNDMMHKMSIHLKLFKAGHAHPNLHQLYEVDQLKSRLCVSILQVIPYC